MTHKLISRGGTRSTLVLLLSALLPAMAGAQQPPAAAPAGAQGPGGVNIQREKTVPVITSGKWTGAHLADGQPDVSGHWSNTIANHNNFTDPQGGVPGDPSRENRNKGPRSERAPSRVSDPADGLVPFQPWALQKQQELLKGFPNPTRPEFIEPLARCAPAGIPKSFMWHGFEIRQFPGVVLLLFGSGTRVIYLDSRPHLPENVKLWNADSRGHWEGNTLVVDVTNNNAKARFGRTGEFASENVHVVERYIFQNDGARFNYVATFTDPTVYTRPFTVTIPIRRYTEKDEADGWHYEGRIANRPGKPPIAEREERICVENNGDFGNVAVSGPAATPAAPAPTPAASK